jgi:hypothetical protein
MKLIDLLTLDESSKHLVYQVRFKAIIWNAKLFQYHRFSTPSTLTRTNRYFITNAGELDRIYMALWGMCL